MGLNDQFHFVHETFKGENSLSAQLLSFDSADGEAKTGLMMRESLEPGAQYVDLIYTNNHGLALQWRQNTQGVVSRSVAGPNLPLPLWLNLKRTYSSVPVDLARAGAWQLGQWVEVVGKLETLGDTPRLVDAEVREPTGESTLNRGASLWPILQSAQILHNPGLLADLDIYKIRGSVRFSGNYGGKSLLAVQDETGGIFVNTSLLNAKYKPEPGQYVEIQSTPGWRGGRRTELTADNVLVLGEGVEPRPLRHPLQYALPKRGAGTWTESIGIVRSVLGDERISIKDQGEIYTAYIQGATRTELERWVDRSVRLRGVTYFPSEKEMVLLVSSPGQVEFQGETLPPLFQRELRRIADFEPTWLINQSNHRVRLAGTVLYAAGNRLIIQDGAASARVILADADRPKLGQRVEVAGFPDADDQKLLVVSEARIQVKEDAVTEAIRRDFAEAPEGSLTQLRVRLLAREDLQNLIRLTVTTGDEAIYAYWDKVLGTLPEWPLESVVDLTGIKMAQGEGFLSAEARTNVRGPLAPALLLRSLAEIQLVEKPRWWVVKRTLLITGSLCLLALLAGWRLHHLRTRVAQRTKELNEAMARLRKETQTAATLAERNRLAGEIHDSMEQGLSALLFQIDSTAKKPECPPDVRAGLTIARNMVTFNRAEVKHAVWDLQSPLLEDKDLPHALQELIHQLNPEKPRIQFSVTGQVRELPPRYDHHLLRIAQEALTNAIKHSDASEVELQVHYDSDKLTVSIKDNGKGFQPSSVLTGGVGHFGLRSLRGRAGKIDASLTIESEPGHGTHVLVRVPLTHL